MVARHGAAGPAVRRRISAARNFLAASRLPSKEDWGLARRARLAHKVGVSTFRRFSRAALGAAFACASWLAMAAPARAASEPGMKAYVIADDKTGHILASSGPNEKLQIGSLTKIATAIVTLDWARYGGHALEQAVTIPAQALAAGGINPVGFQEGDQVTLRDLLYAALLQSDNVAAETIATYVGSQLPQLSVKEGGSKGGSSPGVRFVAQMNALARQLGMERTRFLNPTGLDNKEKPFSTAADLARLTRNALTKADFRFYVAQKERRITITRAELPVEYLLRNTNELIGINRVDGVKTGQTARAGSCLVITAARDPLVQQEGDKTILTPRRLIVVVLGSPDRFRDGLRLLTEGTGLYDQWAAQGYPADPKEKL
jgi:D-alanyl-D-alanine carboxypeptidase (penicillin-binding protein 5/6)